MSDIFSRNRLIYGENYLDTIKDKHVAVFGLGGVGGYALESLARFGIGNFTIIDFDTVALSNINRQIIALNSTLNVSKTELFKKRLSDINPNVNVRLFNSFYTEELNSEIFNTNIDYVVDAIDTLKSKIQLLSYVHQNHIPTITCLGAGNRKNPTEFHISDISQVNIRGDNFSKNILRILKKENITQGIKAVWSGEQPIKQNKKENSSLTAKKSNVGSSPFVVSVAGYYMGYAVANDLSNIL